MDIKHIRFNGEREFYLKFFIFAVIAVLTVVDIAVGRGLFADGSHYLVSILLSHTATDFDKARLYVHAITQFPVVLGLQLGLKDIQYLIYLQSFGLCFFPVLFWAIALFKLKDDIFFWPFVLLFAVVYLNLNFMAIGEYNLAYAMVACCMAILLRNIEISAVDGVLLVIMAAILTRVFEAMVFLGLLLIVMIIFRLISASKKDYFMIVTLGIAVLCFAAAAIIAAWAILYPRDPANLANAKSLLVLIKDMQLLFSLILALLYFLLIFFGRFRAVYKWCGWLAFIALLALTVPEFWARPVRHYNARVMVGYFTFCFGFFLTVFRFGTSKFLQSVDLSKTPALVYKVIPLAFFCILATVDLYHSFNFNEYIEIYRYEVNSRTGLIPIEDTMLLKSKVKRYGWGWTNPSMSLLLRENESKAIILNPIDAAWQPFDPHVSVPDLGEYYKNTR